MADWRRRLALHCRFAAGIAVCRLHWLFSHSAAPFSFLSTLLIFISLSIIPSLFRFTLLLRHLLALLCRFLTRFVILLHLTPWLSPFTIGSHITRHFSGLALTAGCRLPMRTAHCRAAFVVLLAALHYCICICVNHIAVNCRILPFAVICCCCRAPPRYLLLLLIFAIAFAGRAHLHCWHFISIARLRPGWLRPAAAQAPVSPDFRLLQAGCTLAFLHSLPGSSGIAGLYPARLIT